MNTTWIVAANAGRARFFSQAHATAPLEEVDDMVNEAPRLRTADTETDDLGRRSASTSSNSIGAPSQSSGYEPHQTPAEHQTELFARSVAAYLLQGHRQKRFGHLRLIASPEFLGHLRKLLDPNLDRIVSSEINKDYTSLNAEQLRERIRAAAP